MEKADMRKGMLLKGKIGAEERIYRVLDLKEKVLVLDCVKKTMPVWKTYEELSDCVEKEEEAKTEAIDIIDAMEGESRKTAYQRYNMISGVLPFLSEESMRTEAIKRASERYGISKQTVRNYLCEYLATMDVRSLVPGNKKAEKKLSVDEKNMRKSLNKWYYTTKKRTLKNCYTLMLQHFYCNADGTLKEEYPSYYQFRYFYRKYNKKETEYISRNGLSYYQRNQRPLTGDGVQAFAPTIGMGMLDATVCDIYLVNESGAIVGRPILTLYVDAYSGVICGYSLSWEGGIYSLRNLMLSASVIESCSSALYRHALMVCISCVLHLLCIFMGQELTEKEIGQFVNELSEVSLDSFIKAFEMGKNKIKEYPHCDSLIYSIATVLNAALTLSDVDDEKKLECNNVIVEWLERTAESPNEKVRISSIFMLAAKYIQMEKYKEANIFLDKIPDTVIDATIMKTNVLAHQEGTDIAAFFLEGKLMQTVTNIQNYLYKLIEMEEETGNHCKAEEIAEITEHMVSLFGLWDYGKVVPYLLIAVYRKDVEKCIQLIKEVLMESQKPWKMVESPLYYRYVDTVQGKSFSGVGNNFVRALATEIENKEEYEFLKGNKELEAIFSQYLK